MNEKERNANIQNLKNGFEGALGVRVKTIVDYSEKHLVVVMDDPKLIPGRMFKVHKESGDVSAFTPVENLDKYFYALRNRSYSFEEE